MPKVIERTLKVSHDNIESAVVAFLYSVGAINDNEDVVMIDLGLPVDENGMVEVDLEVVR